MGNETLRENYLLRCTPPPAAQVDRVVVRFSHRRDAPLRWSLGKEDEQAISARRWSVEEQLAAGPAPRGRDLGVDPPPAAERAFEIRAAGRRNSPARNRSAWPRCRMPTPRAGHAGAASAWGRNRWKSKTIGSRPLPSRPRRPANAKPCGPPINTTRWPTPRRRPSRRCWCGPTRSHLRVAGLGAGTASCNRTTRRTAPASTLAAYRLQSCGESSIRLALPPGRSAATSTGCGSTALRPRARAARGRPEA